MSEKTKFEVLGMRFEAEGKTGIIVSAVLCGVIFTGVAILALHGTKIF